MKLYDGVCCGTKPKGTYATGCMETLRLGPLDGNSTQTAHSDFGGLNLLALVRRGNRITERVGELDCDHEEKHCWALIGLGCPFWRQRQKGYLVLILGLCYVYSG